MKSGKKSPKSAGKQAEKKEPLPSQMKRKREESETAVEDKPSKKAVSSPLAASVAALPEHVNASNLAADPAAAAADFSLANQFQERQLQQLQQERQRLLMNEMIRMNNPALNRMSTDSFLGARNAYAASDDLRRRREQMLLNMQMSSAQNQQHPNTQTEIIMRAAAAAAHGPTSSGGLGNNPAAFLMGNSINMGTSMGSSMSSNAFAAQHMGGGFPSSAAGLMGNMGRPLANLTGSPLMHGFPGRVPMGGIHNPAMAAASASNFPPAPAAGGNSSLAESLMSQNAALEPAAKRLAPARGVFNKSIKSKDEVIDSLARANARFYKSDGKKAGQRFRGYQCEQWTQKYQELLEFQAENGNCQVPHCYKKNIGLARWVKRQRYQYKLMIDGKQSTMTDERVKLLEDVGFIWDSHAATWEERLNELREYRRIHGDCNVPSSYSENPKLATWIKCQRRQYKLLQEGRTSNMTLERMTELQRVGFSWRVQER